MADVRGRSVESRTSFEAFLYGADLRVGGNPYDEVGDVVWVHYYDDRTKGLAADGTVKVPGDAYTRVVHDLPATYTLGEFRGWLDTVDPSDGYEVLLGLARVSTLRLYEERAYCVAEGLRRGVFNLRFAHYHRTGTGTLFSSVACAPSMDKRTLRRPFVGPGCDGPDMWATWNYRRMYRRWEVVDVLPELPLLDRLPAGEHQAFSEAHLRTYFQAVADRVDRRTLLLRGE